VVESAHETVALREGSHKPGSAHVEVGSGAEDSQRGGEPILIGLAGGLHLEVAITDEDREISLVVHADDGTVGESVAGTEIKDGRADDDVITERAVEWVLRCFSTQY